MAAIVWSIEFADLPRAQKAMLNMERLTPATVVAALYGIAEEIMTESKEIVPVDTGNLKSTGHVQRPELHGRVAEVTLGYGGTAANGEEVGYAWWVHETLEAHHKEPSKAKYLEDPINEHMNDIDGRLARALDDLARLQLGGK